jgi:hypothetical protein
MMVYRGRSRSRTSNRTIRRATFLVAVSLVSLFSCQSLYYHDSTCNALDATWTPAEGEGNGPLPLSQSQRDQLTQLDDAIRNSPNPTETLQQVAQSNQMDPQDLYDMLTKNRKDMEMTGGGSGGGGGGGGGVSSSLNTLPRRLLALLQSLIMAIAGYARRDPKKFGTMAVVLLATWYMCYTAPRTGIVLSSTNRPFMISSGFTTMYAPPRDFVLTQMQHMNDKIMNSSKASSALLSLPKNVARGCSKQVVAAHTAKPVTVPEGHLMIVEKKTHGMKYSITSRKRIPVDDLQQQFDNLQQRAQRMRAAKKAKSSNDEGGEDENSADEQESDPDELYDLVYESACNVVRQNRLTEFSSSTSQKKPLVAFYALDAVKSASRSRLVQQYSKSSSAQKSKSNKNQFSALVVGGMGDYGRFGIQPFQTSYESEEDSDDMSTFSVGFTTLKSGHFDGEMVVNVQRRSISIINDEADDDEDTDTASSVIISVSIVVPPQGRMKVSKKLTQQITRELCQSILRSSVMDCRRNMAQHLQSSAYHDKSKEMATKRRRIRSENVQKMEAMDEDRRRRWQRGNPDAGHYRPSGHRMQSPNNC